MIECINIISSEDDEEIILRSRDKVVPSRRGSTYSTYKPSMTKKCKPATDETLQEANGMDELTKFFDICLAIEPTDDMKSATEKLKRKCKTVDPKYLRSDSFRNLIDRYSKLMKGKVFVYKYLREVADELNKRRVKPSCSKKNAEFGQSTSQHNTQLTKPDLKKLKTLESVMSEVKEKIEELELGVVDWDDEEDSHYLQEDKYKRKYMQLYNEYCRLRNEKGLVVKYLRLKDLDISGMTNILSVDESILQFVNQNIKEFNNVRVNRPYSIQNASYVPDYVDILQCITEADEKSNLQLPSKKIDELARRAFETIVKYLKKQREYENCSSYVSYLEAGSEDPATTNEELMKKLKDNKKVGEQKLNEVFEEYARKQDNLKTEDLDECKECEDASESSDCTTESVKKDKPASSHSSENETFVIEDDPKKNSLEDSVKDTNNDIDSVKSNQSSKNELDDSTKVNDAVHGGLAGLNRSSENDNLEAAEKSKCNNPKQQEKAHKKLLTQLTNKAEDKAGSKSPNSPLCTKRQASTMLKPGPEKLIRLSTSDDRQVITLSD